MRTFRTLAALLAVLALSACGTPAANGSASSAGASAQRDPLPADPAEDSLSVGDAYELYREVTVSNGRVLTLIAHGERQDEACFGISSIDVMDGDALVQTVSLYDGIVAGNAYDDFEDPLAADATRTFDLTSGLDTQDYNFDGFPDLAITEFWGTANERRLLWLWDDTAGTYAFALPLVGTEIRLDESAQAVITTARSGPAETVITRYAPAARRPAPGRPADPGDLSLRDGDPVRHLRPHRRRMGPGGGQQLTPSHAPSRREANGRTTDGEHFHEDHH